MNNIAPKPPLARQANNMAGYGRYGDSQLVHMNPYEVQGLAAMSPTGQLTTNPTTGQPEAFLPFLAPLIAPMLGSALGTAAFGGAIGSAAAGAIGSGLATWAATGDFEKGVVGGLTGFGLGQVLGAGADAAKLGTEVGNVATAQTGLAEATKAAAYSPDLAQAGEYLQGVNPMANAQTMGSAMAGPPAVAKGIFPGDISGGMTASTSIPAGQQGFLNASQNLGTAQSSLASARAGLGPAQRLSGLGSVDGLKAMGKQALSPSSMLPIGVGLGTQAQLAQQDDMEALRKEKLGQERAYSKEFEDVLGNAIGVSNRSNQRQGRPTSSNPYAGQYATGGIVEMDTGGYTDYDQEGNEDFAQIWRDEMANTISDASSGTDSDGRYFVRPKAGTGAERQSFLRGDFKQDAPTDYRHGFEKEFQFFDYVKDREVDRELDSFGSGPEDYLAGLLAVDASTLAELGTPNAPGTHPLNTYTTTKGDQFSGIDNFSTQGLTAFAAAPTYTSTVDTVAGGGDYGTPQPRVGGSYDPDELQNYIKAQKLAEAKRLKDIADAKAAADAKVAADAKAAAETRAAWTGELDDLGIDTGELYTRKDGELVYDVMQNYSGANGPTSQDIVDYYSNELNNFGVGAVDEAVTTIDQRRDFGDQISAANEGVAIAADGDYTSQEADAIFDMLKTDPSSIDALSDYYDIPVAAIEDNIVAMQEAKLQVYGSDPAAPSSDDVAALVQGISSGDFTVAQVAAQFGLPEADVQAAYDSMSASTGGRMASGGQAGTKRFMTSMGPIELAGGGIAEIPVNQEFMQEIPPEMAMVQEQVIAEEPLDTDYNELIALTVEAIRGNIENPDAVINMFIEEYGQERFLELRTAVLQSIVPNAQTEGLIAGSGSGMDDEVMGMIGENQPVAVSPGEYIVAADVLSGLGDGNSDAGADVMDEVQANVRMARSGGRQPAPIDLSKVMPA